MEKYSVIWCLTIVTLDLFIFTQAQQRPRILEHPADAVAAREEPLTLNCKAAGRPPPEISWYHNGTPLVPSERRVVLPEGSLFFLRVMQNKREQDAGVYWCEARSTAGVAVSRNATLQIAILRDDFRLVPKDTVALVGGPVVLNCTPPRGIPEPSVLWYMNGKLLDLSGKRLSMVDLGSMLISEVQASDAGKYECSAQSMAGSKTAPAVMLKVLAPPTVIRGPQDSEVIEGEGLDMPCELTGDPKPTVAWHRDNGNLPEGRSRVLLDNTLRIEDARPEDQGRYICKGHNEGGNVSVAVKLYVYASPSFIEAPSDVELQEGGSIKLPCRAQGRPKTRIIWDRVGLVADANQPLNEEVSQYLEEETQEELLAKAKIMSLRSKRNGSDNETVDDEIETLARSKRQAIIDNTYQLVEHIPDLYTDDENLRNKRHPLPPADGSSNIVVSEFRQIMRDENDETIDTNFPRRKREITNAGDESVANIVSSDSTPILFFSTPAPTNAPSLEINENGELVLKDVTKKDQGWYACAALNEAGSSVKRIFVRVSTTDDDLANVPAEPPGSRWGSDQNIILTAVTSTSAYSLDVSWEITDGIPSTTLKLHYRSNGSKDFQVTSALIDSKKFSLTDLKAHTEYEVFATISHGLGGSVSNIRKGKTMDGPPTAPPTDVRVGVINNTAAYVRWSPPPSNMLNGELTGYKIQIKSNSTNKLLGQMSLNATTQSVVINSLSPGGRYIARVAPLTAGGLGPYSAPAPLHMDPSFIARPPKTDPAAAGWASSWMSGIALGILGICLVGGAIFAVYWARRNKRIMKASYPGPTLTATLPDKQHSLWLHGNTLLKPMHTISPPQIPSEYAEVTQTILPKINTQIGAPPEPYATVTLQRGAQSDDSCIKCSASPSSSEYNAPVREPLNLCDVLPPPPDHPYGSYKPPNNMTIRTNPAAMSPQVGRRVPPTPPGWRTLPPPIPTFPQNWDRQNMMPRDVDNQQDCYSENDYESGSVLYEQCCRQQDIDTGFFSRGGEPTEEYYRNINMEFLEEDFEPSTPPPPCPDSYTRVNSNIRLMNGSNPVIQQIQDSPINNRRPINQRNQQQLQHLQQQQQQLLQQQLLQQQQQQQLQQQQCQQNGSGGGSGNTTQSAQSSDDSESDNRWAPPSSAAASAAHRSRRSRSRSKSSDRKYLRNNNINNGGSHVLR